MREGDDNWVTDRLQYLFLLAGADEAQIRKLENDQRFLEFLQRFNSVEQIATQLVDFGEETQSAATGIALRLHLYFEGHPKPLKEFGLKHSKLTFALGVLVLLALEKDKKLTHDTHGFDKTGADALSKAFLNAWTVFLTEKFIEDL